jgi:hypothetical protein
MATLTFTRRGDDVFVHVPLPKVAEFDRSTIEPLFRTSEDTDGDIITIRCTNGTFRYVILQRDWRTRTVVGALLDT